MAFCNRTQWLLWHTVVAIRNDMRRLWWNQSHETVIAVNMNVCMQVLEGWSEMLSFKLLI
jgi:hypothetical protein